MTQKQTRSLGTKEVTGVIVGKAKKVIDPNLIFELARIGCKDHEIATALKIDSNTLRYQFTDELETGRSSLKQSLRKMQIEIALAGNVTMLIWLGKNILKQTDVYEPLTKTDAATDLAQLSEEELEEKIRRFHMSTGDDTPKQ